MNSETRTSLQKRAAEDVTAAVELLAKLQSAAGEEDVRSALPTCAGVAFMWVSKIGLGLGMDAGHGFVIHRRPYDEAKEGEKLPNSWSAPLFFNVSAASLGLTVGFSEVSSVVVLKTRESVNQFAEAQREMGLGAKVALGSSGEALPGNMQVLGGNPMGDKTKVFSIVKGLIQLDLSINWPLTEPWQEMNRAVYGSENMDPKGILHGDVKAPSVLGVERLAAALPL